MPNVLRLAADYFLLGSISTRRARFRLVSMCLRPRRVHVFFEGFRFSAPQNAKNFPASQGRAVTVLPS